MSSPLLVFCCDPEIMAAAMLPGAETLVLDLGAAEAPGDRAARRRAAVDVLLLRRAPAPARRSSGVSLRGRAGGARDGAAAGASSGGSDRFGGESGRIAPPAARPFTTAVRIAPLASGLVDDDLDAVMAGAPDAVLLPAAVGGRDEQHLAAKLAVREAEHGLAAGRTRIVAMAADTPAGVLALATLTGASPRLVALGWDPAALAAALGTGPEGAALRTARDLLLIAAAAAGVSAFACGPAADDAVAEASDAARRDGFAGTLLRAARPEGPFPGSDRAG